MIAIQFVLSIENVPKSLHDALKIQEPHLQFPAESTILIPREALQNTVDERN
jgi:hypothetical protein